MTKRVRITVNRVRERDAKVVSSPTDAALVLQAIYKNLDSDREHFVILALDSQNRLLGHKVVATGGVTAMTVDPKTLFRDALLLGATSLILAHNHPSGDPTPSAEDTKLTHELVKAGELLAIKIHDHIILGLGVALSLAEKGLLK